MVHYSAFKRINKVHIRKNLAKTHGLGKFNTSKGAASKTETIDRVTQKHFKSQIILFIEKPLQYR